MTAEKSARRRARRKSSAGPTTGQTPGTSGYGNMLFGLIETRLKSSSNRRAYIPPEQLARALRENAGVPLPPAIHDYLCDFLEGKIKAPGGRPSDLEDPAKLFRNSLIPPTYERYLTWLQKRKRTVGLEGWARIRNAVWWQGPPNERAARMTSRRFQFATDWRSVQNIVSEANKKR